MRSGKTLILTAVALGLIALGAAAWFSQKPKPCTNDCNILLISVDSLNLNRIGAYGYKKNRTTPNLDKLSKKSYIFKNYYSAGYLTPVTEASVQTGLYPTTNDIKSFFTILPKENKILPEYLKSRGYYTQSIISSPEFTDYASLKASFNRGYDSYNQTKKAQEDAKKPIQYSNMRAYPYFSDVGNAFKKASVNKQKTFTWLAIGGVHWPYGEGVPNQFGQTFYDGNLKGQLLDWPLFQNVYNDKIYPDKKILTSSDKSYINDMYDNGVYAFDKYLGQVMDELKRQKLDKKTIVVIESEHGEGLGEHGYYAHYDIYDTEVHQPLLIYDPRLKGGKNVESFVGSVDILPTILELSGSSTANKLQGKSIVPILKGKEADGKRQEVFIERVPLWEEGVLQVRQSLMLGKPQVTLSEAQDYAIRTNKWKYISRDSSQRLSQISYWQKLTGTQMQFPAEELFDLQNDPLEKYNVAAQNPEVVKELKAKLLKWKTGAIKDRPSRGKRTEMVQPYL